MAVALHLIGFFLLSLTAAVFSEQHVVPTLPGFAGPLPFKLETGYIGVGDNEQVQLFYYFIESEGDPDRDPLLFWLTGGPGCSGFSGLVYEIGPLRFDLIAFDGSFPSLITNPYSWTKAASIIFIDSPVGTGSSYSTTPQGYNASDTITVQQNYMFFRKWMQSHPKFMKNWVYVAGDSFGGKLVPMVSLAIAEGNEARLEPRILLQGYIIGNPRTLGDEDNNERIPYAHRMALVSDEYYEMAKRSCNGSYVNPDPNNIKCTYALQLVNENYNYVSSYVWMNNETVQEALHIKEGSIGEWKRCNKSLLYEEDVPNVVEYHRDLNEKGFQALVYSGDHDLNIPYLSTLKWIRMLNLTMDDDWRSWTVNGQVAGYTEKYKNNQAYLTFATVKGAGHTAPEYKPIECLQMLQRWLSLYDL